MFDNLHDFLIKCNVLIDIILSLLFLLSLTRLNGHIALPGRYLP